ncbi:MAG: helix-turn-helix domain-containing protein [Ruminococcus sp.]|nr:helix-turn-helix domain-containing protein [Ruminococcus sp.]
MVVRKVFDGAFIMHIDINMKECISGFRVQDDAEMLSIDHCREGRMEFKDKHGSFSYLQEQEVRIDTRRNHSGTAFFPLSRYRGISIGFETERAEHTLKNIFGGFSVDISTLKEKFCSRDVPYIMKEDYIEHLFSELYFVPKKIKKDYYKIKTLELILYLDALQPYTAKEKHMYFFKEQIEKVKAIEEKITSDLQVHYNISELAEMYDMSVTSMKDCFKEVFGDTVYSYLKRYKMNKAAALLADSAKMPITEISGLVGYENASKFSSAFKSVMGQTPMEYRKTYHQNGSVLTNRSSTDDGTVL